MWSVVRGTWEQSDGGLPAPNAQVSRWVAGLSAEMKLVLALTGLLATLVMPQPSDSATPGNSSSAGKEGSAGGGSESRRILSRLPGFGT